MRKTTIFVYVTRSILLARWHWTQASWADRKCWSNSLRHPELVPEAIVSVRALVCLAHSRISRAQWGWQLVGSVPGIEKLKMLTLHQPGTNSQAPGKPSLAPTLQGTWVENVHCSNFSVFFFRIFIWKKKLYLKRNKEVASIVSFPSCLQRPRQYTLQYFMSINVFLFKIYICSKESERSHLLLQSSSASNRKGWTRTRPKTRSWTQVFYMGGKDSTIGATTCYPPGCTYAGR